MAKIGMLTIFKWACLVVSAVFAVISGLTELPPLIGGSAVFGGLAVLSYTVLDMLWLMINVDRKSSDPRS